VPPKAEKLDWGFVLLKPEFRGRPASSAPATQEVGPAERPPSRRR
jgi:hypothetical protein